MILAIGAPHAPVDSDDRMAETQYGEVLSQIGDLRCMICELASSPPKYLHDVGCEHCPCRACARGL